MIISSLSATPKITLPFNYMRGIYKSLTVTQLLKMKIIAMKMTEYLSTCPQKPTIEQYPGRI
jgi:hypothetical protein